jgi:hypothetical protein
VLAFALIGCNGSGGSSAAAGTDETDSGTDETDSDTGSGTEEIPPHACTEAVVDWAANTYLVRDFGAIGDGVTNDLEAIRNAFAAAMADPEPSKLVFDEAIYRITGSGHLFHFQNVRNKMIEGNNALIVSQPTILGAFIEDSENIVVQNLAFDMDPLPWTQGDVSRVDRTNGTFHFTPDDNYPLPTQRDLPAAENSWGMFWEPTGYTIKNELVFIDAIHLVSGRTYELVLQEGTASNLNNIVDGDRFTIDVVGIGGTLNSIANSGNVSMVNITIYAARAVAFVSAENSGSVRFSCINILRKPGTTRLLSAYRDGFHCVNNRTGVLIESSYIEGLCDDAINLHSNYFYIETIHANNHFTVDSSLFSVGDTLIFINLSRGVVLGNVLVSSKPTSTQIVVSKPVDDVIVGSQSDPGATRIFNISMSDPGFRIVNNTFAGQRRYAMLIRSPNGTIKGNTIRNTDSGMVFANEIGSFHEGPLPSDIIVENNTIENVRRIPIEIDAKTFGSAAGEQPIHDFVFRDNAIGPNLSADVLVRIKDAKEVVFERNHFINEPSLGSMYFENDTAIRIGCGNTYNGDSMSATYNGFSMGGGMTVSDIEFVCD